MTDSIPTTAPRVRFAPSPTGYFHVGGARTALFNWLYARQHQGTLVLRIEDTDEERNRSEWTDGIIRALDWLGLHPDEGPYFQSEQGEAQQAAIEALWASGALYACRCTREEIDERTKLRAAAGDPTPGYDGHCRDLGLPRGEGNSLRFRTPDEGVTTVVDLVRGVVEFPNRSTEDFICVKGNGKPLFVMANAVDDRTMAISHVLRGEDLFPTTPKQIMLWQALNEATDAALALPVFAHLPLLVNEQGKKLSKRRDPVAVEMYREQGYLPAAFRNYLALLGWSPGEEEIVPLQTLIDNFALEDVQRSPAFFDLKKLTHMDGVYIRALSVADFIAASRPWVDPVPGEWAPGGWRDPDGGTVDVTGPLWPADRFDAEVFARIAPVVQERVSVLSEVPAMVDFLFLEDPVIDEASWQKAFGRDEVAAQIVQGALDAYATCEWTRDELHAVTKALGESLGRGLGKAQAPIRVAVTGRGIGPPLFESLEVLGRDETRRRLETAQRRLGADR
ncbi:MAG TPA: glutamate--tRNA ligase [Acidimicrobiales bacterium]|nr:glutamate--tRNA ligase [Acidimicrobiales bacterium]